MSSGKQCECDLMHWRVLHRKHSHTKWQERYSSYSIIICLNCGNKFRSKAQWVDRCSDVSQKEQKKIDKGKIIRKIT